MKAFTKVMSLLLLVAMCMSFMAAPAYAAEPVGRVTADMMGEEPAFEPAPDPAPAANGDSTVQAAESATQAAPAQKVVRAVLQKANGSEYTYETLAAAISNAASGDVVVVKSDASFGSTLFLDKKITLVNYGHTLTVNVVATSAGISGSGATIRGGAVVVNASPVKVAEGQPAPVYQPGIVGVTLDDVRVSYSGPWSMLGGSVTVYGGNYSSDPGAHVAPGYETVLDSDGRYKVQEAKPVEGEEPAVTEETVVTEEPVEGEEPVVTEEPAEGEEPVVTEEPTEGEEPVVTEEPVEGEEPVVTEEPVEGEEPAVTEEPAEGEEPAVTEEPAEGEEPVVTEEPVETATPTVIEQITNFLFGSTTEEEDVDEEAKNIEHNSDKLDTAGNTTVTVSGAPDEATLQVSDLGFSAELEEKISENVEGEVKIVKALDINVEGEIDTVEVTIESPSFIGLSEAPSLWHMVGDTPVPVTIISFDGVNGKIVFAASSFSPYVVTVPDVMDPSTKNDEEEVTVELAPDAKVKDGDIQTAVDGATTGSFTVILSANATWNVSDWGSVDNLEINLKGHTLTGPVDVPSGKTLTITGTNSNSVVNGDIDADGNVVLAGTGKVKGDVNLNDGSLYIDGSKFPVSGTIAANGSSFVEIGFGSYGAITADSSAGGHITGGTFKTDVPENLLAPGYSSIKKGDNKYQVEMTQEATVKTINGAIEFSRNGGNYVEFYKGEANAAQNYSFQFAVTKKDGLTDLAIMDPSGTVTALTTEYTYDTGTGRVVISKNSLSTLLNSVPAGRGYIQFTFANGSFIEVPLNIYPNVTFEPTTYVIDSFEPVVFTMTDEPSYITVDLKDGENPYNKLLDSSNYSISGDKLTLSSSYLNLMKPGSHNFDFWYDMGYGKTVRLRCTVLVSQDYKIVQINNVEMYKDKNMADVNWYQYSGKNLNFTANGDSSKFTGVKVDGKLISAGNYLVTKDTANGTTNVGLYPGYLATLAQGKHTISVVFTDGEATATFNVLGASSSPKTGDNNNMVLWAAVLVLSGAAVVALIPKKKKQ